MTLRVGDAAFYRDGRPTVVKNKDNANNTLQLEHAPAEVKKAFTHGYVNGISNEDRGRLNEILTEVKTTENPRERVMKLKEKIDELDVDVKNMSLVHYLTA